MTRYARIKTPLGPMILAADAEGLISASLLSSGESFSPPPSWKADRSHFDKAETALRDFFAKGTSLPRLKRGVIPGSAFQHKVWQAIEKIPLGQTRSYGEIAREIGHPGAARAVGSACGANPLMLFVPCHRVLGARGGIGGYGFCGIETKKKLLNLEGHDW